MIKKILAIVPALMPSVNIGIINSMRFLQKKGNINFKVTLPYLFQPKMLDGIDCVIFCRNSFPNEEWILNEVVSRGIPYIYEIDDNFFEIPYDNELGRNHRHPINLSSLINFISYASVVRTYSHLLAEDASFYNKNVEINRVYFDLDLIKELKQNKSNKLKIVYATSRMADSQQDIFTEALYKIALNYQDKVEVYFFGAPIVNKELKNLSNVFHLQPIYNYEKFIKKFYEMGFDIGLAPIFEGRFFNSKTNNKYREYGACKIAGIYSNEDLYSDCVVNEQNGLLVDNTPREWYEAIEKLILDDALRNTIIKNANKDIVNNYSFEHYCDVWMQTIYKAVETQKKAHFLEIYLHKGCAIECFLVQDASLKDDALLKVSKRLKEDMYLGTSIQILFNTLIDIEEMYKVNVFLENQSNIILVSDNILWIEYFDRNAKKYKINFILLTNLNKDVSSSFVNVHTVFINDKGVGVYENYKSNIYIEIDYAIKKYFEQTKRASFIERVKLFAINKIKNNWLIRKIQFVVLKQNSIKLRLYTWWKVYKINRGK